jgi:hypothetical protein
MLRDSDRMEHTRAPKSAADFIATDRCTDMMHDAESGPETYPEPQQRVAERGHSARVAFILIMERSRARIEDDDLGCGLVCGRDEVVEALGRARPRRPFVWPDRSH